MPSLLSSIFLFAALTTAQQLNERNPEPSYAAQSYGGGSAVASAPAYSGGAGSGSWGAGSATYAPSGSYGGGGSSYVASGTHPASYSAGSGSWAPSGSGGAGGSGSWAPSGGAGTYAPGSGAATYAPATSYAHPSGGASAPPAYPAHPSAAPAPSNSPYGNPGFSTQATPADVSSTSGSLTYFAQQTGAAMSMGVNAAGVAMLGLGALLL